MLLTGCSGDQPSTVQALPALPPQVQATDEPARGEERPVRSLTLALVGEVRGEIEPCGCPTLPYGGYVRRERLLAELRGEQAVRGTLLHLDAGEVLLKGQATSDRAERVERAKLLIGLQETVGVDVWAPGPTDLLSLGVQGLDLLRKSSVRVVSATWRDPQGRPLLPESAVIERDGLRVGVIGLSAAPTDPQLRDQVSTLDPVAAAKRALAALPTDLDLVVALGNVPDAEADRVAAEVPGLAAVLTTRGRSYDEPRSAGPNLPPVIEAPDRGRYVQVLDLRLGSAPGAPLLLAPDANAWREARGFRALTAPDAVARQRQQETEARFATLGRGRNLALATPTPLGAEYDGDAQTSAAIEAFKARSLKAAVAQANATPAAHGYASSGACVNCHTSEFARWTLSDHARAWEGLLKRKATANPECVACHSTGFGEPGGLGELTPSNLRQLKGVQCESCHGPMRGHPQDETVKATPVSAATCVGCHDEANSPNFAYEMYLARATCQGGAPSTAPLPDPAPSPPGTPTGR